MSAYHVVPSGEPSSPGGARAGLSSLLSASALSAASGTGSRASAFMSNVAAEAKFRWDKPSRLIRMERGTCCYRFTLLFLSVLIVFSGYFQFDLPAIAVCQVLKWLDITPEATWKYSALFMGYSISNTIVPLLSGPFFGRFGKWAGVTVIAATITAGIFVVWFGMLAHNFWVVLLGRTIYGLGGESVFVGVDILVTKWFRGAEIGFAYGLIQAAGQAGSFSALYSVPALIEHFDCYIDRVFAISVGLSCAALVCLGMARLIEKTAYGKRAPKSLAPGLGDAQMHEDSSTAVTSAGGFAAAVIDDALRAKEREAAAAAKKARAGNNDAPFKEERLSLLKDGPVSPEANEDGADDADEAPEADTDVVSPELQARMEHNLRYLKCIPPLFNLFLFLGFGHIVTLGWRFFAVTGGIICYSSAFYTFLAFGPAWLQAKFGFSDAQAGRTAGIIAIFSMIVSPSMGLVMDKRGGQRYVCAVAMFSSMLWFAIMGFTDARPELCIVFAGLSYSLLPASLYPLLPEVVPAESFTIVYAVLNSAINLVFTVVLAIAGNVLGADTASLGAVRTASVRAALAALARGATNAAATAGRHLQEASGEKCCQDPGGTLPPADQFKYVFAMFVSITCVGTLCCGALAYDGYKNKTGWVPLASHH